MFLRYGLCVVALCVLAACGDDVFTPYDYEKDEPAKLEIPGCTVKIRGNKIRIEKKIKFPIPKPVYTPPAPEEEKPESSNSNANETC